MQYVKSSHLAVASKRANDAHDATTKRRIMLVSVVALIMAILAAMTLAYFTTTAKTENVITASNVRLTLNDSGNAGQTIQIMPGDTVEKTVSVKNLGDMPFYVRVRLEVSVSNENLPAADCLSMNINTADWTYKDGYYYYKQAVQPGTQTIPLFTKVSVDGGKVDNRYLAETFTLATHAYGVQSAHNTDSALTAAGWPSEKA